VGAAAGAAVSLTVMAFLLLSVRCQWSRVGVVTDSARRR
jgi:hypothetical protein